MPELPYFPTVFEFVLSALACSSPLYRTTLSHTLVNMTANPILNPNELKAHLNLLRAFHDMKSKVESGSKSELDVHTLSPKVEWKSFVQASVERCVVCERVSRGMMIFCCFRFQGWVSSLKIDGNDVAEKIECPPLDVCLVWHAYMLNPG